MTVGEKPVKTDGLDELLNVAEQLESVEPGSSPSLGVGRKDSSSVPVPRIGELGAPTGLRQAKPSLKGVMSPTRLEAILVGVRKDCHRVRSVLSGGNDPVFEQLAAVVVSEVERQLDGFLEDIPRDASLITSLYEDARSKQGVLGSLREGGWPGMSVMVKVVRERHMMSAVLGKDSRARKERLKELTLAIERGETNSLKLEQVSAELLNMLRDIETGLDRIS